ncbi:N-acetylglucosamine-6-phosphate deacetylase [Chrysoperla carnea]|uniref:N-acetylglucosamine-6-phosphate deacetylase n=1 Tax=Chrysoperla carnea TaxID=189513 RepID=UPI001D06C6AB|nr:N-acetylglucosamine-6-phosphate deacetylase [Chrysoperla carnea]
MNPSSSKTIQFSNCRLLRHHKIILDDLWVRNGKVINPEKVFFDEKIFPDVVIDCKGVLISPGFVELQINGGFGVDFSQESENVEEDVRKVSKGLLAHGVTAFCPTLVTSPKHVYHKVIPRIKKQAGGKHGATILGLHIEGPYINKEKKGAHPPEYIRDLDEGMHSVLDMYGSLEDVKILTLAPELSRAPEVIEELTKLGITVSVGHSIGNLSDGELAVKHGATMITHLFNAMLPFHHRDPGLVGLLTSDQIPEGKTIYFGIISDGIHTHPTALRIAHRTHPDGLFLVTDAISALGLEEGTHYIGQLGIDVRGDSAYITGTNTLCGSISSMNICVQIFKKSTSCSTVTALEAATLHPARAINMSKQKGTLDFDADADFIFLDDDLNVLSTWISGECVYEKFNNSYEIKKF